jgi:hypothetical protein
MRRPLTVPIMISEFLFELRLILWLRHASICLLDQLNFVEFYVVSLFQSLKSYHYLSLHLPSVSQYDFPEPLRKGKETVHWVDPPMTQSRSIGFEQPTPTEKLKRPDDRSSKYKVHFIWRIS